MSYLTKILFFMSQVVFSDLTQLPYDNFLKVHPGEFDGNYKQGVQRIVADLRKKIGGVVPGTKASLAFSSNQDMPLREGSLASDSLDGLDELE